jgi:CheY-like chemotaxis protein
VDDYPENNAHPRRILEEAGMSFTTALSTEEALAALSHGSFDLIISDMGRGADATAGLTLLRELRQRGVRTPTIIYASSRGLQSHGATARELGAVAAVSGSALLLKQVAKVLGDEGDSSDDG